MTRKPEIANVENACPPVSLKDASSAPLSETFSRVAATELVGVEAVRLGVPVEPGWVTSAELASDGELIEELLRRLGREYGSNDRAALGTLFLRGYLWRLLVPIVSAFLIDRRMSDPGQENVALNFDRCGVAAGLAFASERFVTLPDDPAAEHPDAQVFAFEDELLVYLRDRLAAGLPDFFAALRRVRPRRSVQALWGVAADVCAEAFMHAGQALGREDEARAFAEFMLGGPSPLSGSTNYVLLEHDGFSMLTRVRNTCCLYYKVGEAPCFTCPRTTNEERVERLAAT